MRCALEDSCHCSHWASRHCFGCPVGKQRATKRDDEIGGSVNLEAPHIAVNVRRFSGVADAEVHCMRAGVDGQASMAPLHSVTAALREGDITFTCKYLPNGQ